MSLFRMCYLVFAPSSASCRHPFFQKLCARTCPKAWRMQITLEESTNSGVTCLKLKQGRKQEVASEEIVELQGAN